MADQMIPLNIKQLFQMVSGELKSQNSIFGISRHSFFNPADHPQLEFSRYGQPLETPLGVAAGPHTQLAQNIISSWLCGARYIELKTVQTLDQLEIDKPCIDMEQEGYNCEWSQELTLDQSFDQYLNAWVMIHLLQKELKLTRQDGHLGAIFNMSIGYDLKGILSENVQRFIKRMQNCSTELAERLTSLHPLYPQLDQLNIPTQISNNITLSTMHGCPSDEIEKIGRYLIEQMEVDTTIKLNPTLLGADEIRDVINNRLGYKNVIIPDQAFEHDLKYPDCIKILENLTTLAQQKGVAFSIKLTNTLEVINSKDVFPTGNQHSYLSGRPLHPLAVKLASKIQQIFSGDMDISFSAGIDAFNTYPLLKGNIKPLTVCSDLLKPGGYERLVQYITVLKEQMQKENISSIADLARPAIQRADYLDDYVRSSIHLYHKNNTPGNSIKNSRQLGLFDCISAPCQEGCATTQDIPTYLYLTGQKRFAEALKVIRSSNPLPNSTGMACDHLCQEQCTRVNYDRPLQIRRIKHFIANYEQQGEAMAPLRDLDIHVAIVGAGPSGLSAAYFLALEGFKVELFESNSQAGGMLSYAIPDFRLSKSEVELDIERVKKLGVKIHYDHKIADTKQFMDLYDRVNYIYLAMGAARSLDLNIPEEESAGCHDFLSFLKDVKQQNLKSLPNDAVIIGGGNSAIDAARTARRLMPPEHPPTLLYRRTIEQMPAYQEEIEDLLNEGVKVIQLAAPQEIITQNGKVTGIRCQKMSLNENPDRSGRYGVSPIPDSYFEIKTTFIVKAIGQGVIADFLPAKLSLQESADHPFQTSDPKIFMGGDLFRGGSSIIQAVADGKEVAYIISKQEGFTPYLEQLPTKEQSDVDFIQARSRRYPLPQTVSAPLTAPSDFLPTSTLISEEEAISEAKRCLYCDELCNQCVTVCPNRANISYQVDPDAADSPCQQRFQTLNIADFCNECGNCATFCPTAGAPYIDKPRLFLSKEAFELESKNAFYLQRVTSNKTKLFYKKDGKSVLLAKSSSQEWTYFNTIKTALLKDHDYLFEPYDND